MVKLITPAPELGSPAPDFTLVNIDGQQLSRDDCRGNKGLLVMFICNHCPYVISKLDYLVDDMKALQTAEVGVVAIMSNDYRAYPDDGPEHMRQFSQNHGFTFPYLLDEDQSVAKAYDAVCTPDFFGYDADLRLQYRGRLDDSMKDKASTNSPRELREAMLAVAATGKSSTEQFPSMGCSIKWKTSK